MGRKSTDSRRGGYCWRQSRDGQRAFALVLLRPLFANLLALPQVVNFMRQLSDNHTTVEGFLAVLGPGNWGGPPNRSPLANKDEDDAGLITRYLSEWISPESPKRL